MSKKAGWVWMPHAAHLMVSSQCEFHLATYLGNGYIVSTLGEYWPDRVVREIHASIHDPEWHAQNNHLKGDNYDAAYMKHFGYEEIGMDRKYETMVFYGVATEDHPDKSCKACRYVISSGSDLDFGAYNDPDEAYNGHMAMCEKWSRKHAPKNPPEIITRKENLRRMKENLRELQEFTSDRLNK